MGKWSTISIDSSQMRAIAIIIDDMPSIRMLLRGILFECKIHVAGEAQQANRGLQLFIDHQPNLVMLDIGLPDGSGLELLSQIKRHRPQTSVVIISGHSDRDTVKAALELGADQYIIKPFTAKRVRQAIELALSDDVLDAENMQILNLSASQL